MTIRIARVEGYQWNASAGIGVQGVAGLSGEATRAHARAALVEERSVLGFLGAAAEDIPKAREVDRLAMAPVPVAGRLLAALRFGLLGVGRNGTERQGRPDQERQR